VRRLAKQRKRGPVRNSIRAGDATLCPNGGHRPSSLAKPLSRADRGLQPYRPRLRGPFGPLVSLGLL